MPCSRVFNILMVFAVLAWAAVYAAWFTTGTRPDSWLLWTAAGLFGAAVATGSICVETRPRIMFRFLSALFALIAIVALASDAARTQEAHGFASTSLAKHLVSLTPSVFNSIKASGEALLGPQSWSGYIEPVLNAPAYVIFAGLAMLFGMAGRPRRIVEIFVN